MRRLRWISLWLATTSSTLAQTQPPEGQTPPPPSIEAIAHWRRATIGVGFPINDGGKTVFATIGSAIVVATDAQHGCIVTAKHVFFEPKQGYVPSFVMIRLPKMGPASDDDQGVKLDLIVNGQNTWRSLPDDSDLAVASLPNLSKYGQIDAVGIQDFGNDDDIFQGANIVVLGYPALLGQYYLKSPLARSGIISWVDPDDGFNKPFLIDSNLYNGNSGGPVFRVHNGVTKEGGMLIGGGYSFIGIVSKGPVQNAPVVAGGVAISTPNPATGVPTQEFAQVANVGGIGLIEPISKIRKLVTQYCVAQAPSASTPSTPAAPDPGPKPPQP